MRAVAITNPAKTSKSCFANGAEFPAHGVCSALVSRNNFYYTVSSSEVIHLIISSIIGRDVLSQHETHLIKFGEKKTQLDVSNLAAIAESNEFRPMIVDQPKILFDSYKAKAIATKSRHSIKEDLEFFKIIFGSAKKEIVHCTTYPWRAQAFAVKVQKLRVVIDITLILFTSFDAYLFPIMEELPNNAYQKFLEQ